MEGIDERLVGSQTPNSMCESALGVSTPWTRQISGIDVAGGSPPGGASGVRGGTNVPAATTVAAVIEVFGRVNERSVSQGAAETGAAAAPMRTIPDRAARSILIASSGTGSV